jgi:hypothetical protein
VPETTDPVLPLGTRLWFAWVCLIRVLFDGVFAAQAFRVHRGEPALPPPAEPPRLAEKPKRDEKPKREEKREEKSEEKPAPRAPEPPSVAPALQLLALLQREGRIIDFVQQDITSFSDADIGAAARVIHEGCRKALREHARIAPVRTEDEGVTITVAAGFSPAEIKLSGDVGGSPPYTGVLRHRGWRAEELRLPVAVAGHDPHILAPAEVEL